MPNPITRKQFDSAARQYKRDPLREKKTDKEVAASAGVSETTARKIRRGQLKRPPAEVKPSKPHMHDGVGFVIVEPYKCPGCHNLITLQPCLICHERAKRESKL